MKQVLVGFIFALFCINVLGEEVDIEFHKDMPNIEPRSLSIDPTATHDGNTVTIYYTDYLLANVQVTVKDMSGNIVYSNMICVSNNLPYIFSLYNVEAGAYKLELKYGNKQLYGYFFL